jgi:hypothetical protein
VITLSGFHCIYIKIGILHILIHAHLGWSMQGTKKCIPSKEFENKHFCGVCFSVNGSKPKKQQSQQKMQVRVHSKFFFEK